jgi:hypothetical protein
MVAHTCNPGTQETETGGGLQILGWTGLHSERVREGETKGGKVGTSRSS